VEGEKDATTAGELGVLATTADGAGKWRVKNTGIDRWVKEVVVCPTTMARHRARHSRRQVFRRRTSKCAGWAARWSQGRPSDWAPKQTQPALLTS
jgi:hypothetical protein